MILSNDSYMSRNDKKILSKLPISLSVKYSQIIYIICFLTFYPYTLFAQQEKVMIYFYSSETNISNFISLKREFDNYLSNFGNYEFQPFSSRKAFEDHIKDKKKCVLLLSSWHYSKINKSHSIMMILQGLRDGKNFQKRFLVTSKKFIDIKFLQKGPVASASSIEHTRSVLMQILENTTLVNSIRILIVPKDIDALMSVGFDISSSALVTESALNKLKMLDPILFTKIKILSEGKKSELLTLAVPKKFLENSGKIVDIIKDMPKDPDGMNIIKMLDLDGWEKTKKIIP